MWVAADDREFAVRLARYCARNPVALSRLEYRSDDATLTYHSDKPTGPTAGSETVDVLEFLARVVSHIYSRWVGGLTGHWQMFLANPDGSEESIVGSGFRKRFGVPRPKQ